jgi:ribosomal protein S18 acetylase RimI-like enzyme
MDDGIQSASTRSDEEIAEVEIREIELQDIAPVYFLGERLFSADKWPNLYRTWDEYDVLNLFASDRETCLVAELNGQVVGFALGTLIEKRRGPWYYGYLLWLGVDPSAGRRGIGARLVKRLKERFIEAGARMMLVDTDGDNDEAIAFFRKQGFGHEQQHIYFNLNLTREPGYQRLRSKGAGVPLPDKKGKKSKKKAKKKRVLPTEDAAIIAPKKPKKSKKLKQIETILEIKVDE